MNKNEVLELIKNEKFVASGLMNFLRNPDDFIGYVYTQNKDYTLNEAIKEIQKSQDYDDDEEE